MMPENLYSPNLHTEIFISIQKNGEMKIGPLAKALLKQNGLTRGHISTKDFEDLKDRIKTALKSSKRLVSRVELIDKNQHTIVSICSE